MSVNEITVVCDSPRHARGKIATVRVYHRFPEGWQQRHLARKPARRTRRGANRRTNKRFNEAIASGDNTAVAAAISGDPRAFETPRCNLCGAQLAEPNQFQLEKLANQGVSRISIKELHAIILSPKR